MDTQKTPTPMAPFGQLSAAAKHLPSATAKYPITKDNKENPKQSPMRKKGGSKRSSSNVSDENSGAMAFAFGTCAASLVNTSLGPMPLNQQTHYLANSMEPPNGTSAKPKLLFGDSTASSANQANMAPVMTNLDLTKVSALKSADMPPSFEQEPTWVGTPRPDENDATEDSTDDSTNLAARYQKIDLSNDAETDSREEMSSKTIDYQTSSADASGEEIMEETKAGLARFKSLREQLCSAEFKNELYTAAAAFDQTDHSAADDQTPAN